MQFDAVGGLVPLWSSVPYREQQYTGGSLTNEYSFRRSTFDVQATAGFGISYGFGRRRRVLVASEWVLAHSLDEEFRSGKHLAGGGSFGLQYRFWYR